MTVLAAVILAGGRSSRMGQDKALISLGSETLIQRTCRVAAACVDRVYVVTPWPDRYRSLVPSLVRFVEEETLAGQSGRFQGPLVALVRSLDGLHTQPGPDWVLVLACDLPNLSAATLQAWRNDLATVDPNTLAYLPQRQGRWEPLCGFYRATALEDLRRYVAGGGRSFQPWLNQRSVEAIPVTDDGVLANLNTPADWAEWSKNGGKTNDEGPGR
jgi:molybdenum cofactor guanylyltransferase